MYRSEVKNCHFFWVSGCRLVALPSAVAQVSDTRSILPRTSATAVSYGYRHQLARQMLRLTFTEK
ncbi:MAG: hypothetical protein K6G24_06090 [Lachnospiraceae bacterium]|nr:hypothetical protein [Lachnospiraceae bacterium]